MSATKQISKDRITAWFFVFALFCMFVALTVAMYFFQPDWSQAFMNVPPGKESLLLTSQFIVSGVFWLAAIGFTALSAYGLFIGGRVIIADYREARNGSTDLSI